MNGGPKSPQSPLARMQGPTVNAEETKVFGWNLHGILVVSENDGRLTWVERDLVRNLGEKLYGRGRHQEVKHG